MNDDNSKDSLQIFLQAHAPEASKAPESLEASLLLAIKSAEQKGAKPARYRRPLSFGFMLLAVALLAWIVSEPNAPVSDKAASQLEEYMESSWEGAMATDQDLGQESMLAELDEDF